MKGLYVIWPDFDMIDKAIAAGIDTLLVSCYNFPNDGIVNPGFDTYQKSMSVIERYKGRVKCYLIPSWVRQWITPPINQQFVYNGSPCPHTPCFNNRSYAESRINPAIQLVTEGKIDGLIIDSEQYSGEVQYLDENNRCECPACCNATWNQQWDRNKDLMKSLGIGLLKEIGTMPYKEWWNFYRYSSNDNILHFDEDYYTGFTYGKLIKTYWTKLLNSLIQGYKTIPGVWLEVQKSDDDFFDSLKKCNRFFGGWWIYPQMRLTKYSGISQEQIDQFIQIFGQYDTTQVNDSFFERLKDLCNQ